MPDTQTEEIAVYPTLVVGVGGTGCKIAKRLKRTLQAEGRSALNIKFIGMDTDIAEVNAHNEAESPLDRFFALGGKPIHFDPKDHTNASLMSWLPTNEKGNLLVDAGRLGAGQGAGGHRLVGRFAFNYFMPDQLLSLQQTIDQLLNLGNNPLDNPQYRYLPGLAVYVVGSFVGGTGSGCFLDALATLHMLTERTLADRERFFSGYFLLPSVFQYRAIGSQPLDHQATAYSCIKDTDLLLSTDDAELLRFSYYNESRPYELKRRLLDSCYLVDRYSGCGALLRDEDVYDFVATHLYASLGTPFGAASRSVANNSHKTDITDPNGGRCSYSAFGLVGLDYSPKLLRRYCAARLGVDTIDLLTGSDMPQAEAEADATSFLSQLGLSGGRGSGAANVILSGVGGAYIKKPEAMEDERSADLYSGLTQGLQEFERALSGGSLSAELQKNFGENLTTAPDTLTKREALPGAPTPVEPQMWRYQSMTHIEATVRERGLRAGKRVAEALSVQLEQSYADFEAGMGDVRANVQTAQAAFNDALAGVHALTPAVQIFRPALAREAKRDAVRARNGLIQSRLRAEACELARRVFNDDTLGVKRLVSSLSGQIQQVQETLETIRRTLQKRAASLEAGSHEGAEMVGAPDRSVLLYDVIPGRDFARRYTAYSDRRQQLRDLALDQHSALRLLESIRSDNKAEVLAARLSAQAGTLFPELDNQHILEVLTEGTTDPNERQEAIKQYLRRVVPNLSTNIPVINRPGQARTYDYCVVLYPRSGDDALDRAFEQVAEEVVREAQAVVQIVPTEGPNNRIILTYMQHGIPLNAKAFGQLERWRDAYEDLLPGNPYLEVDKRWREYPGPGQRRTGSLRQQIWTLGVAYGLIAKKGEFFYANIAPALQRQDPSGVTEREQNEVDLTKIAETIRSSPDPLQWFAVITQGPSDAQTVPVHNGSKLGAKARRDKRDLIGQGRAVAMQSFLNNVGEDYQDVADGISAIIESYAEERGRSNVRQELTWYRDALDAARTSGDLEAQLQTEINQINALLETLERDGEFGLLTGHA